MDVLIVIGVVLAAILLLILVLLLLPVRLLVSYQPETGADLKVKFFGFTVYRSDKPKKEKAAVPSKKQKTTPKLKDSIEEWRETIQMIKGLLEAGGPLTKHLRVKQLKIEGVVAGENAAEVAMQYGTVCSLLYPFIGYLKAIMKIEERGLDVSVNCDFESDRSNISLTATLSAMLLFVVMMFLKFAINQAEE
ncbi:MAG: hypothetical protein IJC17_02690 [Clostridia bacterium]|nr:hypothetical protein [Clostridia bacterium]